MNDLADKGYRVTYFGEPHSWSRDLGFAGGYTVLMERDAQSMRVVESVSRAPRTGKP